MKSLTEIKTKTKEVYERKNLGRMLDRRKVLSPFAMATLFLDKFVYGQTARKEWQHICLQDFIEYKIDLEKSTFTQIRNDLVKKRILICQASNKELSENKANDKAGYFKLGDSISDYVAKIKISRIPERLNSVEYKIDSLEENKADRAEIQALREENKGIKERLTLSEDVIEKLSQKMDKFIKSVLEDWPPDTAIRRAIVAENFDNPKTMKEKLKEERNLQ
ncbi:hypothetical protein [Silvanigrella sp.]|jgi:hypothetical protein|uniref:hypothetical protein n=1 Tax=Silvanigrella sp. TaxID=2024976 RepID=UPI0037C79F71